MRLPKRLTAAALDKTPGCRVWSYLRDWHFAMIWMDRREFTKDEELRAIYLKFAREWAEDARKSYLRMVGK